MAKKSDSWRMTYYTLTKSVFVTCGWDVGVGLGTEEALTETAWTGYDAGVRLSTAALDNLYVCLSTVRCCAVRFQCSSAGNK
jgi:hypothetical protein